ncbi:OmpA family protein [Candidatus Latescibacterota bacterium]
MISFALSTEIHAGSSHFSLSLDAGRGLNYMQTARTFGKGMVVFGIKNIVMQRKTRVFNPSGYAINKKDYTSIVCVPVTFGLTDEIDLSASVYGYHNARSWKDKHNMTSGYGPLESGIGASRIGVKIRLPFSKDSRVQIAGRFGAVLDTSAEQLDGLNYRWTRTGTDIEASLHETFDITSFLSINLEEGYVMSGTDWYDDQFIGALGLSVRVKNRLAINLEVNNRTFLGKSPQSVFKAANNPDCYENLNGLPAIGNPMYVIDTGNDFREDFFIVSPSVVFRYNDYISLDVGAHINIADQVDPKETFQIAVGVTFNTSIVSMIDSDGDGIRNNRDIESDTPRDFPVDSRGKALDTDNDSVPDGIDREPNTPFGARIDARGTGKDFDGDGVYDGLDMEPLTPHGCPVDKFGVALDDDRDGVPNGIDMEPDTLPGVVVDENGVSLDGDGDGVPDGIDMEHNSPAGAVVDRAGVSVDGDGDGVPDGIDEEPNTPEGILVDKRGRALIKQEFSLLKEGFIRLNPIYFAPGSVKIAPESYQVLDEIGRLMLKYPSLNIQVEGHTDRVGDKALNMRLARARAEASAEYIFENYPDLTRKRFRIVGFGDEKPIASNNTSQGRQSNRRVEFVIINQDN